MVVHYAKTGDKFKFDMEADYSDDGDVEGKYIAVGLSFDGFQARLIQLRTTKPGQALAAWSL